MSEVDFELWKLGIPAKTRHNEVAPAQFEIAPMFEELNLAVDHNLLVMETLKRVAERHGLACLLHEKPFAGVNGSGKHNNWSINPPGDNLLNPGKSPHKDARFLTVLCAVIKAVDVHADLLRATIAGAGNDHRLGANEAPPAIISIFLGEQLTDVIDQLEKGPAKSTKSGGTMKIGVDALPVMPRDATDRNRTSPFAFTGNKFEFRAVGSTHSCAGPNIVLNTIAAEALDEIATKLEKVKKADFNKELQKILQGILKKHKRVVFNGDNYSEAWVKEAKKRGLPNLRKTPEALKPLLSKKAEKLFGKYNVLSKTELHARYEVYMENYETTIKIEGELALDMANKMILPVAIKQQSIIAENLLNLEDLGVAAGASTLKKQLESIGMLMDALSAASADLYNAISANDTEKTIEEMQSLRLAVDSLERLVDDSIWPLPTYGEMLFIY
jgi:glutamine synthetase